MVGVFDEFTNCKGSYFLQPHAHFFFKKKKKKINDNEDNCSNYFIKEMIIHIQVPPNNLFENIRI